MVGRVVNIKRVGHRGYDVYIGRPSPFGNPYSHLPNAEELGLIQTRTRREAVRRYETWIRAQIKRDDQFVDDLIALEGKVLGCWCKPEACHGDVILKAIEWAKAEVTMW